MEIIRDHLHFRTTKTSENINASLYVDGRIVMFDESHKPFLILFKKKPNQRPNRQPLMPATTSVHNVMMWIFLINF